MSTHQQSSDKDNIQALECALQAAQVKKAEKEQRKAEERARMEREQQEREEAEAQAAEQAQKLVEEAQRRAVEEKEREAMEEARRVAKEAEQREEEEARAKMARKHMEQTEDRGEGLSSSSEVQKSGKRRQQGDRAKCGGDNPCQACMDAQVMCIKQEK